MIRLLSDFAAAQQVSTNHDIAIAGDLATCRCYTPPTHFMPLSGEHPWNTVGAR